MRISDWSSDVCSSDLALEVAHASLTGVARHDLVKSIVGDVDLLGPKAVALQLSLEQVIAGDGDLLVFGVAVDRDDLEPVEKGPGERLEDVRGGDEEDDWGDAVNLRVLVADRWFWFRVEEKTAGARGRG